MVLAGAGGVDHDQLVKLASQHFSSGPTTELLVPDTSCRYTGMSFLLIAFFSVSVTF